MQPYAAWYGLVTISVILILSGFPVFLSGNWDTANFVTNYIPLMFAPILFGVASYVMKSRFVKVEDMDFITGVDEIIAETYDEPEPRNIWEKFWIWIVSATLSFGICRLTWLGSIVLGGHGLGKRRNV
jgi:amino acid transporter